MNNIDLNPFFMEYTQENFYLFNVHVAEFVKY